MPLDAAPKTTSPPEENAPVPGAMFHDQPDSGIAAVREIFEVTAFRVAAVHEAAFTLLDVPERRPSL
jgi:hypothetical protein